jgi:hypothetical protein
MRKVGIRVLLAGDGGDGGAVAAAAAEARAPGRAGPGCTISAVRGVRDPRARLLGQRVVGAPERQGGADAALVRRMPIGDLP